MYAHQTLDCYQICLTDFTAVWFIGICQAILEEAEETPILGVCLGMQALAHIHGATVSKAAQPIHGRLSHISHSGHPLFRDIPSGQQKINWSLMCFFECIHKTDESHEFLKSASKAKRADQVSFFGLSCLYHYQMQQVDYKSTTNRSFTDTGSCKFALYLHDVGHHADQALQGCESSYH